MKYSEYLILVLATFEEITTKWICAANDTTHMKTSCHLHAKRLNNRINDMCKGNNFITTELHLTKSNYKKTECYTEYRRYILRRLIGEAQLQEKS